MESRILERLANVEEASPEESAEILAMIDSMTEDDKKIVRRDSFHVYEISDKQIKTVEAIKYTKVIELNSMQKIIPFCRLTLNVKETSPKKSAEIPELIMINDPTNDDSEIVFVQHLYFHFSN